MRSIRHGHPDHPNLIARKCIWHLFHWNDLTPAGTTFDQIAIDASYVTKLPTSRLPPLSGSPIRYFLDYFICQRYHNQKYCSIFLPSAWHIWSILSLSGRNVRLGTVTLQQLDSICLLNQQGITPGIGRSEDQRWPKCVPKNDFTSQIWLVLTSKIL